MTRTRARRSLSNNAKLASGVVVVTTLALAGAGAATATTGSVPATTARPLVTSQVHVYRSQLTAAQIVAYSKNPSHRVIVLMRNQFKQTLAGHNKALVRRASTLRVSQRPVVAQLKSLHAPHLHSYSFINAVTASVSTAELAHLRADPNVRAVVPDRRVSLPASAATNAAATSRPATAKAASQPVNTTPNICGSAENPLLQPEALKQIAADTTHSGATGTGVKVAVFPDGLDPNIPDYIRPDGTHAIFDYRDFTGTGPAAVTGGGEAFGDASSIIAQGRETFDLSKEVNPALPLPANCDIKIKGVAPGASLAVMKVFGATYSFDSTILQGLDWAVSHDHVNILSESFGGNPIPDAGTDPVSVFDAEAIAHGITVVASSGDAGTTNTIGGPAAATPGIIGVAASTDYQINAQLSQHGYQLGGYKGWESNNVASISSSGTTEYGPNTVDVIAPGDGGWADCSADIDTFEECADIVSTAPNTPPIQDFGGTSQAAPLTAGVAALVIQSYKATHGGQVPSPSVVKQIITSSAVDLDVPSDEQGAGQVNAARAVALARSYAAPTASAAGGLAFSPSKVAKTASPSTAASAPVTVTNYSGQATTVTPRVTDFGPKKTIVNKAINYDPTSPSTPTYLYWLNGLPEPYTEQTFTVPAGYQRLVARLAYPADPNDFSQIVTEVLFDPQGKIAQDSDPQGAPLGFGQVEVRNPEPGKWHAIYFSRPTSDIYSGPISTTVTVQKIVTAGFVSPHSATIQPGKSAVFAAHYTTPARPGDNSAEVSFGPAAGVVPILTRSLVTPTVGAAGKFSSELTGGNGRAELPGQELTYQFDVPKGLKDLDVNARVADEGYQVVALLADPHGSPVDVQDTSFTDLTTTLDDGSNPTFFGKTVHLSWQSPMPGRWSLELFTFLGSGSGKTNTTISGNVQFNTVRVSSTHVPSSANTILQPDKTTTATITVKNTGNSPEIYYVDPRSAGESDYLLGWLTSPNGQLPLAPTETSAGISEVLVPPATTSLTVVANASKPVNFSTAPAFGAPEIGSTTGKTAIASYSASDVPASVWDCPPTLIGPFSGATPLVPYSCAAFATTATINDDMAARGGNIWDTFTDPDSPNLFDPSVAKVVEPGESTTLKVEITPTEAEEGATVSGYLAVQNFDSFTDGSDALVNIPYTYTVAVPTS
jgi:hypothetical protein